MTSKNQVLDVVSDLFASFVYYDRKDDAEINVGEIERMIFHEEITIDEITSEFRRHLDRHMSQYPFTDPITGLPVFFKSNCT